MREMKYNIFKRMNLISRVCLATVCIVLFASLQARGSKIESADSAYSAGNYEEAVDLYNDVMQKEGSSAGLLYNLGNAYYKLGREGDAMLCYERAKKLDPGNSLIKQNLNFLATKILEANRGEAGSDKGKVDPDTESFLETLHRKIAADTHSNTWAVLAAITFLLFMAGACLYIYTSKVSLKKTGFFGGIICLGLTILFVIFMFIGAAHQAREDQAILMEFSTELLENPDTSAKKTSTPLHRGTKVQILEDSKGKDGSDWVKVRLNSETVGWVKKSTLEII